MSLCEKQFLIDALKNDKRLDFRTRDQFREVKLVVGAEYGTAICTIGKTKVMCAVSASIQEPTAMRPHRGVIGIDLDMSPMGNVGHEHDRLGNRGMELIRLLELIIRDSRCVDVESLCIRTGKEVWKVRADVRILDDDGSLLDCACLATVTALRHFRRPNATVEAHRTVLHTQWEQAPVPLNIYHMPICVTLGFLEDGHDLIVDPTEKELQCLSGSLVVACNKRKEVCALHQSTNMVLNGATMEKCVRLAMARGETVSKMIDDVLTADTRQRSAYDKSQGFAVSVPEQLLSATTAAARTFSAPATFSRPAEKFRVQPSMILNHDFLSDKAIKMEEVDEDEAIAAQVDLIQKAVTDVGISNPPANSRKREVEEVDALLEGLDDLEDGEEEEVVMMEGTEDVKPTLPLEDDSLLKAKKKKKKL